MIWDTGKEMDDLKLDFTGSRKPANAQAGPPSAEPTRLSQFFLTRLKKKKRKKSHKNATIVLLLCAW